MLSLFVLIQAVKIFCTLGCAFMAYLIASSRLTSTTTYLIFMMGSMDALCLQVYNAARKTGVDAFLNSLNPYGDIAYQIFAAIPFVLFFAGFFIKLKALKNVTR